MRWIVDSEEKLLSFVKKKFGDFFSTRDLRWSIEHNRCHVNGTIERFASTRLQSGDVVQIWAEKEPRFQFEKERVIYEDNGILIYDKPPFFDSLEVAVGLNLHLAHRLDRDTTGLLILAKNEEIGRCLHLLFKQRKVEKEYLALVKGRPEKNCGVIELKMEVARRAQGSVFWKVGRKGLWAKTEWECLKKVGGYSLLRCVPHTGRTHQIRVHLSAIHHPILGDRVYGNKMGVEGLFRPLLHASKLAFVHPLTKKRIVVSSPIPSDFSLWIP